MDGLLLIDKPKNWTSFDVVAKVRGIIRGETGQKKPKVGHTGTLDPLATGLLVLTIGSYCKRAGEFSKLDKVYEVEMRLGQTSTTGDEEGEKIEGGSRKVEEGELLQVLRSFEGDNMQTPPKYSAIKVNGQPAYKLARAGKEVKLEPRPVTIHAIDLTGYDYPIVKFTVHVSSGTYIRSLVEDIGNILGTGAYMSNLRRVRVGNFLVQDSQTIEGLSGERIHKCIQKFD